MTLEEVVARCEYAPLHTKYRVYVREPHPRAARPLMSLNRSPSNVTEREPSRVPGDDGW